MARSRTWFVIFYTQCLLLLVWKSKLQTEFALSTAESEITSPSATLRVVIPLMEIMQEMKNKGYQVLSTQPRAHCHVFEDNSGALE